MSVHLKYGTIHPRTMHAALEGEGGAKLAGELVWRDFYADVLWHAPQSAREELQPQMARLEYDEGPEADRRFERWATGTTGYPIVDAGMRQLLGEAYVHNRVRMIVGSFLTKDLHLHWRRGARHFMQHLRDGDLASNRTAGSGSPARAPTRRRTSGSSTRSSRAATTTRTASTSAGGCPSCATCRRSRCTSRGCGPAGRPRATRDRSSTTPRSARRRCGATRR